MFAGHPGRAKIPMACLCRIRRSRHATTRAGSVLRPTSVGRPPARRAARRMQARLPTVVPAGARGRASVRGPVPQRQVAAFSPGAADEVRERRSLGVAAQATRPGNSRDGKPAWSDFAVFWRNPAADRTAARFKEGERRGTESYWRTSSAPRHDAPFFEERPDYSWAAVVCPPTAVAPSFETHACSLVDNRFGRSERARQRPRPRPPSERASPNQIRLGIPQLSSLYPFPWRGAAAPALDPERERH